LLDSLQARSRFLLFKQSRRYLSAAASVIRVNLPKEATPSWLIGWLQDYGSPYKFHLLPRIPPAEIQARINRPTSFSFAVHQWEPDTDATAIRQQFDRLLAFTGRHGIGLYVVNLPENVWNREAYPPRRYERYEKLLRESLGHTPFLDL